MTPGWDRPGRFEPDACLLPRLPYLWVLGTALLLGLALRLRHLLLRRSLWLDEAFLSLAVLDRQLSDLLVLPLPYEQTPPPLFLILSKLAAMAFGSSETVLRALPFASSALALCLFPLFARRHSRGCVALATVLLAVSFGGVYYAAEFKPYATEALLTTLLLLAGMELLRTGGPSHPLALALLFLAAPWMGFPTAFLLAGLGGGLLYARLVGGQAGSRAAWGLLLVGAVSFLAMYWLYALPASLTQLQMAYWKAFEAPRPESLPALFWYGERASLILCHFFLLRETSAGAVLACLALVGTFFLLWRDAAYGLMLVLPLLAVVLLSLAGRFPLHERVLVFALPVCCLLLAEGATNLGALLGAAGRGWQWLPATALLLLLARPVANEMLRPDVFERQEFKQLSEEIRQGLRAGETVFVFQGAIPIFQYYRRQDPYVAQFQPLPIVRGDPGSVREALRTAKAAGRGWVIFAHVQRHEEEQFQKAFEAAGEIRERRAAKGVWAFAFDALHSGKPAQPAQEAGP